MPGLLDILKSMSGYKNLEDQMADQALRAGLVGRAAQTTVGPAAGPMRPGEAPLPNVEQTVRGEGLLGGMPMEEYFARLSGSPEASTAGLAISALTGIDKVKRAAESGMFQGTGMEQQGLNFMVDYNKKILGGMSTTPEEDLFYSYTYGRAARPQRYTTPDGQMYEVQPMDLSAFVPPKQGAQMAPPPSAGMPSVPGTAAPSLAPAPYIPPSPKPLGEKKYTEGEKKAGGFASRMVNAEKTVLDMEEKGFNYGDPEQVAKANVPIAGGYLTSSDWKTYHQAAMDWARSKLRFESGAVIGEQEAADEVKLYYPQPGDTPQQIQQKAQARAIATRNMVNASGGQYQASDPRAESTLKALNKKYETLGKTQGRVISFDELLKAKPGAQ